MIKNVLIIDDSVEIQMLLKLLLESKGYHIECSSNGEDALNILSLSKELPDLIFLDIQMPVMDGLSFLEMRNTNPDLKSIPVILMSGEDDVRQKGTIANVDDVLQKPLSMVSVVGAVERSSRLH